MPTRSQTTEALRLVRQQVRDLPKVLGADRSRFSIGYREAINDAVKVITRHIRRSGDGRAS